MTSTHRPTHAIANPLDHDWTEHLWVLWFGTQGTQRVLVWANSVDDAWEEGVEWLDHPKRCGVFEVADSEEEEEGLTMVGHTTLDCIDGMAGIPNGEWGAQVVTDADEFAVVKERSAELVEAM